MADQKQEGTFDATGNSGNIMVSKADLTISLDFGTGTVVLERSFDDGSNWKTIKTYTADVEENAFEPATGVLYRLNCTAYTADIDYVIATHE